MEIEIWKDVPGYIGCYQASTLGRVRSLGRCVVITRMGRSQKVNHRGKVLKPAEKNGYKYVGLNKGRRKYYYIHKLVLNTFVGPRPPGMECCHYDGIKSNNNLENLRWDTRFSNYVTDQIRLKGKCSKAKLSQDSAFGVKTKLCNGEAPKDIAAYYDIDVQIVYNIRKNKIYKHVPWPQKKDSPFLKSPAI